MRMSVPMTTRACVARRHITGFPRTMGPHSYTRVAWALMGLRKNKQYWAAHTRDCPDHHKPVPWQGPFPGLPGHFTHKIVPLTSCEVCSRARRQDSTSS